MFGRNTHTKKIFRHVPYITLKVMGEEVDEDAEGDLVLNDIGSLRHGHFEEVR